MDEQNSKKDTPEENEPTRLVADSVEKVDHAEKQDRAGQSNDSHTDYYILGLPWPQFVAATIAFLGVIATIGMSSLTVYLRWQADMLSQGHTKQQGRARMVLSTVERIDPDPSFVLTFRNVGETTALNVYGVWLQGECPYSSSRDCAKWCVQPLPEMETKDYGHILSQDTITEQFSYITKLRKKARKKRPSYYFCGYVAYTDVFCMWRRQFRCWYYEPATNQLFICPIGNEEQEQQKESCS